MYMAMARWRAGDGILIKNMLTSSSNRYPKRSVEPTPPRTIDVIGHLGHLARQWRSGLASDLLASEAIECKPRWLQQLIRCIPRLPTCHSGVGKAPHETPDGRRRIRSTRSRAFSDLFTGPSRTEVASPHPNSHSRPARIWADWSRCLARSSGLSRRGKLCVWRIRPRFSSPLIVLAQKGVKGLTAPFSPVVACFVISCSAVACFSKRLSHEPRHFPVVVQWREKIIRQPCLETGVSPVLRLLASATGRQSVV